MSNKTSVAIALAQAITPLAAAGFSALTAWLGIRYNVKKSKKLERENKKLKDQLRVLIEDPFSLTEYGFYVDKDGRRYCGAGCRQDVTAQRVPLKPAGTGWRCPKCGAEYTTGTAPSGQARGKSLNPLENG
jgi:hypothetical protein